MQETCPHGFLIDEVEVHTQTVTTFLARCKAKQCPYCGPIELKADVAHFIKWFTMRAEQGRLLFFNTFTIDPKIYDDMTNDEVAQIDERLDLTDLFANWRKRQRREEGTIEWYGTIERHEQKYRGISDRYHIHALVAVHRPNWSAQQIIDDMTQDWFEIGGGIKVDMRLLDPDEHDSWDTSGFDKPKTVAGSVGWVTSYIAKGVSDQKARGEKHIMRALVTRGTGRHSKQAQATLTAYHKAKGEAVPARDDDAPEVTYRRSFRSYYADIDSETLEPLREDEQAFIEAQNLLKLEKRRERNRVRRAEQRAYRRWIESKKNETLRTKVRRENENGDWETLTPLSGRTFRTMSKQHPDAHTGLKGHLRDMPYAFSLDTKFVPKPGDEPPTKVYPDTKEGLVEAFTDYEELLDREMTYSLRYPGLLSPQYDD